MTLGFSATGRVRDALSQLGRTEDIAVAPNGARIAIAGFAKNRILLLDVEVRRRGGRHTVALKNSVAISSRGLSRPHGLCFLEDDTLIVANREGGISLLALPAPGAQQRKLEVEFSELVRDDRWLYSPGSVCCYRVRPGRYEILVCNNYAHYVTRHALDTNDGVKVVGNELLLAAGLDLPDGVSVSSCGRLIAVSNHNEQALRLYENSAGLGPDSEPVALLRGAAYPHGVVFTADGRFVIAADAGAPFLRIYARNGCDWSGEIEPAGSLRVMSDALFARGNHNPMEGGPKGIDRVAGTNIVAVTNELMPLAFFDMDSVIGNLQLAGRRCARVDDGNGLNEPEVIRDTARANGGFAQSIGEAIKEAMDRLRANDLDRAERLFAYALALEPNHVDANHMLGVVHLRRSRHREASRLMRKAGNAIDWRHPGIRYNYGRMLAARIADSNPEAAARLRCAYNQSIEGRSYDATCEPLVSVVIVVSSAAARVDDALNSVFAQDYPRIELILIARETAENVTNCIREKLRASPFPYRMHQRSGLGIGQALNEGVSLGAGEYVNALDPDDVFAPTRISTLVDHIARRGAEWGFAQCELVDEQNKTVRSEDDKFAVLLRRAADSVEVAETVGSALLGTANPCISVGNLFFSRTFFERVGGFRDLACNLDWDFCLRALWFAEPCYSPASLYRWRMIRERLEAKFSARAQEEVGRLLGDYFARARHARPPNEFAPAKLTMGLSYLLQPLSTGQTRLPVSLLLEIDDELERQEQEECFRADEIPEDGLNLVGYFRGALGLGEAVRAMATACLEADIPVSLCDVGIRLGNRESVRGMDHLLSERSPRRTTVFYLNPDRLESIWQRFHRRGELRGRRVIGYWHWEIDRFPKAWLPALELVDEVWVASSFVERTIRGATDKPVVLVPPAVDVKLSRVYRRSEFSLPDGRFLFLAAFDFSSYSRRKNPLAAIDAFQRAFPPHDQRVGLVLKCVRGRQHMEAMSALRQVSAKDPRIVILDRQLSRDEMYGLQSLCDTFVSLHRSEGFGLALAECMALGMPVIGTAYSGNLDFMNPDNSCLVRYEMIPVRPGEYSEYESGWMWADTDAEDAARYMRRLVAEPAYRQRIATRAAADIADRFNADAVGRVIRERLARAP